MPVRCLVRSGSYFDSVVLMRIAAELAARPGVRAASLVMATPSNKDVLASAGLLAGDAQAAGPNDLVVAVDAGEDAAEDALAAAEEALRAQTAPPAATGGGEPRRPRTLGEVAGSDGDAGGGLAIISTPGQYAAAEAMKALRLGMNAFVFSDNVPLEQEVELKREAHGRGLIVMGPDCGTAIVGGVPLGFANEVRAGDIGLIGASGTGLQQVSSLIDRWGAGVSQVIGVGSHDLGAAVGGVSMLDGVDALAADPATRVLGLVSKPPDPEVAVRVLARAATSGKPVVAAFLGADPEHAPDGVTMAATLEEAARALVAASTGAEPPEARGGGRTDDERDRARAAARAGRRLLRGLYAGGTFAYEARLLLEPGLGAVSDQAQPPTAERPAELPDAHLILDLGDDRFTVGRPHPMIDPAVRLDMLRATGEDPCTAVIVLDVVLGHLAADDPAGDLAPVIAEIAARDDAPRIVCFVVGTGADPQGLERQERALRDAGAVLAESSSAAAALADTFIATEVAA
jgi:FdrA protein